MSRWADSSQAFWALVVAVATVLSILRLSVESGGDMQVTLLLASSVSPINLITVLVTTVMWLYSAALVVVFAIGTVIMQSAPETADRYLFVRWTRGVPLWLRLSAFALALASWEILFLPLWFLLLCAAFQLSPYRLRRRPARPGLVRLAWLGQSLLFAGLLGAYGWVVGPTVLDAYRAGLWLAALLLAAPVVLLLLGASGPISARTVPLLGRGSVVALLVLGVLTVGPIVTTPILPLSVLVTGAEDAAGPVEPVRGYVVAVDDTSVTVFQEDGGVVFVPGTSVRQRILCPDPRDFPRYRLWTLDLHVEESILQGLGRRMRPPPPADFWCNASLPAQRDSAGLRG